MEVSIRDSVPGDAHAIFDLRCDSRLAGTQYPPSFFESPTTLFTLTQPGPSIPDNGWMCSTILVNNLFAGHITQAYRTTKKERQTATLGWNIVPDLWGNGIAPNAVNQLVRERFEQNSEIQFVAFCFESNVRCLRVIEKLGFESITTRWSERTIHFIRSLGKHKLLKFGLS